MRISYYHVPILLIALVVIGHIRVYENTRLGIRDSGTWIELNKDKTFEGKDYTCYSVIPAFCLLGS